MSRLPVILMTFCLGPSAVWSQPLRGIEVLIVTAHPDDEAMFAGSAYRISKEMGGAVDLAVITDGAGGFRYSGLSESIYGLRLTEPEVAAQYLPAIRKRELITGGHHVGLRAYFFLDEPDRGYATSMDSVLSALWDADNVIARLEEILRNGDYDFVLTHLPRPETHAHHKAATLLAIRATARLESARRPVVLGAWISEIADTSSLHFDGLPGYPEASTTSRKAIWRFDRTQRLDLSERLDYKVPASWLITEHRTQGTMQRFLNRGDVEEYWAYSTNPVDASERASKLFAVLRRSPED